MCRGESHPKIHEMGMFRKAEEQQQCEGGALPCLGTAGTQLGDLWVQKHFFSSERTEPGELSRKPEKVLWDGGGAAEGGGDLRLPGSLKPHVRVTLRREWENPGPGLGAGVRINTHTCSHARLQSSPARAFSLNLLQK